MSNNENRTPFNASKDDEERSQDISPSSGSLGHQLVNADENTSPSDTEENTDGPNQDRQNAPSTSGSLNQNTGASTVTADDEPVISQAGQSVMQTGVSHSFTDEAYLRSIAPFALILMSQARTRSISERTGLNHRVALRLRPLDRLNYTEEEDDETPSKKPRRKRSGPRRSRSMGGRPSRGGTSS